MAIPTESSAAGGNAQPAARDPSGIDDTRSQWVALMQPREMNDGIANNGADGEAYTTAYLIVVSSVTETLHREIARALGMPVSRASKKQRDEVCAAVWTMIRVALAASLLTPQQQELVLDVMSRRMRQRWQEDLGAVDENAGPIKVRAAFYLQQVDPQDPVTTAARIAAILLEAAQIPADQRERETRLLAGLIAHRIVSDAWLFNAWESEGKLSAAGTS